MEQVSVQDEPTDYQTAISEYMTAIDHVRQHMAVTQVEIDCLKAETQAILARLNTGAA